MVESSAIYHLIGNYAPKMERGTVHRDWNEERLRQAPRQQVTLEIEGTPVETAVASCEAPLQVNLATLEGQDRLLVAASLGGCQTSRWFRR